MPLSSLYHLDVYGSKAAGHFETSLNTNLLGVGNCDIEF
jgi:hypothetical protein